jgi:hypothetical protein
MAWPLISDAPPPLTFLSTATLLLFAHRRPQTEFNGKIPISGFYSQLKARLPLLGLIFHKETAGARSDMVSGWLLHNGIFRVQKLSMWMTHLLTQAASRARFYMFRAVERRIEVFDIYCIYCVGQRSAMRPCRRRVRLTRRNEAVVGQSL